MFLLGYGALAARRALRPAALTAATDDGGGLGAAVLTTLALTWLNPHVYLDTVVLLGAVANGYGLWAALRQERRTRLSGRLVAPPCCRPNARPDRARGRLRRARAG